EAEPSDRKGQGRCQRLLIGQEGAPEKRRALPADVAGLQMRRRYVGAALRQTLLGGGPGARRLCRATPLHGEEVGQGSPGKDGWICSFHLQTWIRSWPP